MSLDVNDVLRRLHKQANMRRTIGRPKAIELAELCDDAQRVILLQLAEIIDLHDRLEQTLERTLD